ncbi:bifunctional folylpolyglutamate synthase/dihydrofolate synthase, partial [Porphyromonadaceae bacterium OttesenSCG-928-L07]|nr:bifunctional folylpolyglutamate synthase/dihydrofolate synthase [Porphyromonadaceae bacterium OttesenSCG-928-L07]
VISGLTSELKGMYQSKNIPAVVESAFVLQSLGLTISEQNIRDGIARTIHNTGLLGRWQVLSEDPYTVCDTGHNEDGIKEILKQIDSCRFNQLHFVLGVVNDKDIDTILKLLPKNAVYYFCKASIPRALNESILAEKAQRNGLKGQTYPTVEAAYKAAKQHAGADDMIYIGGSTFVVAEVV